MTRRFLFMLIISAIMFACGDGTTKKLVKELNSSYDNEGKEVTLTCYITQNGPVIIKNGTTSVSLVYSNMQQDAFAYAQLNFGKEANCVWMPEKFRLEDIEIYDNTGRKYGVNTEFTIKGIVHYTNKNWKEELSQADKPGMFSNSEVFKKMREKSDNDNKKAAEDRKKKTGDPNDYSFEIIVNDISVAK
ncbi:MAG: hypothetical protein FWF52_06735 [Candidatus Azobacteroides sp.]|nr:hypothetical protein [Candidatus Azobacteroides sp.]